MKIGIISDTHQLGLKYSLTASIKKAFLGVDLIVHVGDIIYPSIIQELEKIAPIKAIKGNKREDKKNFKKLPKQITLSIGTKKLAIIHCPNSRLKKEIFHFLSLLGFQKFSDFLLINNLLFHFKNRDKVSCVIFGDTHRPFCKKVNNVLFLNPGAAYPNFRRPGSVMVLNIEKKSPMTIKLIYFFS